VSTFRIHEDVRAKLVDDVRDHGDAGIETGAFLLGLADQPVTTLALAGDAGVARHKRQFRVTARALHRLFTWADQRELQVVAQAHSHGGAAFLSRSDLRHGFSVNGFTTAVIPYFGMPPQDPAEWGWWRYEHGEWIDVEPPGVIDGAAAVVVFDESGVRER
jgi:hypothetical protein